MPSPAAALNVEHAVADAHHRPERHRFAAHLDVQASPNGRILTYPLDTSQRTAAGQQTISPASAGAETGSVATDGITTPTEKNDHKCALVVDDTVLNVKLMCRLLRQRGWITIPAYDGVQAVGLMLNIQRRHTTDTVPHVATNMVTPSRVDVVFIDRNMPNMDGPEAVKRIRASGYTGLIVGLTGDVSPSSTLQFLEVGANLVIPKPVDIRQLDVILNQVSQSDSAGGS